MSTSVKQTSSIQDKIIQELEASPDKTRREWIEFEDSVLRNYYGKKPTRLIAKLLHRSICAVGQRAIRIGLNGKCEL